MKKRKSKKKSDDEKAKAKDIEPIEDKKPFDFGGLPTRDIKKNLGCG
jgi:hypothetical protein